MRIKLLIDMEAARSFAKKHPELIELRDGRPWLPAGTEDDWPDAWTLVNGGFAEAADDECRKMCEENPPTPTQSQHRAYHERIMREQQEFREDLLDTSDYDYEENE